MTSAATERRLYVACLASYNNGVLHGEWIDATQGIDGIREDIAAMLRESKFPNVEVDNPDGEGKVPSAEEWAIHDYEGFEGIKLSEYEDLEKVAALAEAIEEHGEAYAAYVGYQGIDYADPSSFEDHYRGEYDSETAYAEHLIDEGVLGDIPEALANYIDAEKLANDLFMSDCYSIDAGGGRVYVFDH